MENKDKKQAEKTFSIGRGVWVSIWKNESEKSVYYNVSISRSYKTPGGETKYTTSFRQDELLFVAEGAHQAFDYLLKLGEDK